MNKGFTLVELLAVLVVISIISTIGVFSFSSLTNKSKDDYYKNMISNLELAANTYFSNNREERPPIGSVCNKVPIKRIVESNLISDVKSSNGVDCDLENSYVYIKRKNNKQYEYNVSLICGSDEFLVSEDEYCQAEIVESSTISVSAKTVSNKTYNVSRIYDNTDWINEDVLVTFNSKVDITKYVITNITSQDVMTCDANNNVCTITISNKGTYNVTSYNDVSVISSRTFNVRIDKNKPTFSLSKTGDFNISDGSSEYTYKNSLSNVKSTSGISKIDYDLYKGTNVIASTTVNSLNIEIRSLKTGVYTIHVWAYDKAGNKSNEVISNFRITREITLLDPLDDSYNVKFKVIDGTSYNYLGTSLPQLEKANRTFVGWSTSTTSSNVVSDTSIVSSSNVVLYAKWS